MTELEKELMNELMYICDKEEELIKGRHASRFRQMLAEYGPVSTCHRLIGKDDSFGFGILWENKLLHLSMERVVLNPKYRELFTVEERRICYKKLKDYGFDCSVLSVE